MRKSALIAGGVVIGLILSIAMIARAGAGSCLNPSNAYIDFACDATGQLKMVATGKDTSGNPQTTKMDTAGRISVLQSAAITGTWGTPVNVACNSGGSTTSGSLTAGVMYDAFAAGDLFIKIGTGAAITDRPMAAKEHLYFKIAATGGSNTTVACITGSGSPNLSLTPLTPVE